MAGEDAGRLARGRRALVCAFAAAVLVGLALAALRYGVIENDLLPRDCGPGGSDAALPCGLTWLLVQSFHAQRLGWVALAFGLSGFVFRSRLASWAGLLTGVAGLVLYSPDYAAVGGLLAVLALLRIYNPAPGDEGGQGEREAGQ